MRQTQCEEGSVWSHDVYVCILSARTEEQHLLELGLVAVSHLHGHRFFFIAALGPRYVQVFLEDGTHLEQKLHKVLAHSEPEGVGWLSGGGGGEEEEDGEVEGNECARVRGRESSV